MEQKITELEECKARIETLSKALEEANTDRIKKLFKLASLGDEESINQIDAFLTLINPSRL